MIFKLFVIIFMRILMIGFPCTLKHLNVYRFPEWTPFRLRWEFIKEKNLVSFLGRHCGRELGFLLFFFRVLHFFLVESVFFLKIFLL